MRFLFVTTLLLVGCGSGEISSTSNTPEQPGDVPASHAPQGAATTVGAAHALDAGTTSDAVASSDTGESVTDTSHEDPAPACGTQPPEPASPPRSEYPRDPYPMIALWEQPVVHDVVALTFDDGPKPETTNAILDILKTHGIRATFFLNSRSHGDFHTDPGSIAAISREIAEGHVIGNHTAHHADLAKDTTDDEGELSLLDSDWRSQVPCFPPLTLVRAPYGNPYISGPASAQTRVYPIVARHGVHIGWAIDSLDYTSAAGDTKTWVNRVLERIDAGRRGPILMHDTEAVTAGGLESLIQALEKRGIGFVTAEKLVRDKYGKTSGQLLSAYKAAHP